MFADKYKTPIADALLALREKTKHSFHALPVFNGNSIVNSELNEKYKSIYGDRFLGCELTTTGKLFDSFFFSSSVIRESEDMAARLFGADGTLYVTTGTTTSNQIAATALYQHQGPVLIDKSCHQSIHFIFDTLGAPLDYIRSEFHCEKSERSAWNIDSLLQTVANMEQSGRSYEVIVLTAQSYEGVIYNVPKILSLLLKSGIRTRKFLIDEAWGAANYFNPELKEITAMNISDLMNEYPDLEVICTQSSHKSLSTLRQASMIHFRGPEALRERLNIAKFRIHSTSPSYPILASLDMARAQMEGEGEQCVANALQLAEYFKEQLKNNIEWSCYHLCAMPDMGDMNAFVQQDPCKVSIDINGLGMPAAEVQAYLFNEHGVYVNRITKNSILLNFHIGIQPAAVSAILAGLAALQRKQVSQSVQKIISDRFIIPYPPGVPLVVPGEQITDEIFKKMEEIKKTGIAILTI
ncbi:aminotransferase class I/II-fold pyridoxal phosphate-dependent enzyme [Iodobacter sp. HSC-16F04]|uniref:Aminotransferase class I/II-fold pyridoxal phosphate-dependent enzyme n=1 Tax=Iodobacter violaceini TaxID=3044271 RepID=A0ABX0L0U8_9NEIS|nr:aminotransferase class I/II-fold pyridoxal phosphate-dependent enzyme [Iodobacter violacea]NHQ87919.1 aminotransferase class I/II-fold pyridoxal phosphate-dependent enzyme [Iodobacter violacea]